MKEPSPQSPDKTAAAAAGNMVPSRTNLRSISAVEQAAILLLSMGDSASAGVLRHFSREEIVSVSQAMARSTGE